jgi:hypothetical protein
VELTGWCKGEGRLRDTSNKKERERAEIASI